MEQITAIDDGFISERELVVGTDSRGHQLSSYAIAERLTQVDIADYQQDLANGDYTVIAEVVGNGFRGYHNMSPGELWALHKDAEDKFYGLLEDGALPYLFEDDPAVNK